MTGNKSQAYHFNLFLTNTIGNRNSAKTAVVFTNNVSRLSLNNLKKEPGAAIMKMMPIKYINDWPVWFLVIIRLEQTVFF